MAAVVAGGMYCWWYCWRCLLVGFAGGRRLWCGFLRLAFDTAQSFCGEHGRAPCHLPLHGIGFCSIRAHDPAHLSLITCVEVLLHHGPGGKKCYLVCPIPVTFRIGPHVVDHDLVCRAPFLPCLPLCLYLVLQVEGEVAPSTSSVFFYLPNNVCRKHAAKLEV